MGDPGFLADLTVRALGGLALPAGLAPAGLYIGPGNQALEVAVIKAATAPSAGALNTAWKARRGGRATPVLLVALHGATASLCGPSGEDPPVYREVDRGLVERLCREALTQPDRHAALRFLNQALPSLDTQLPGLRNEGLFALHELAVGMPPRPEFAEAAVKARKASGKAGRDLLGALGFKIEALDNLTLLLKSGDRRTALAVLVDQSEAHDAGNARFNSMSPITYALVKADTENLDWVIVVQGNRLRLYPRGMGIGVGRRGRTETYVECQPSLLSDANLAYLWLLFSAEALTPEGTLHQVLERSTRFAGDLAKELRERIYNEVVPALARGLAAARKSKKNADDLVLTYEMALTVLFRLLFVAYAEDRDLLPYTHNQAYRRRSLKQKAQELAEAARTGTPIAAGTTHWDEVARLWDAVNRGNTEWSVPAYDGGLFSDDHAVSPASAALAGIRLPNDVFEPALRGLLLIDTQEGPLGPVDFRALGVREFGTVYEGLLESELSVADTDLALDSEGTFVRAKRGQTPVVRAGEVYLHNRSGARKSSGSYFTKDFAVDHLLDAALEPALSDHFKRLMAQDDTDAAEAFFDFRVADIAMGSGHFLVAAVDRIERSMSDYLAKRRLPVVQREFAALRTAAQKQLGELADQSTMEDSQLLRRLIARRCIYGVDLNALAVQLARLSLWVHTFVPGLPLSLLDHNLVRGNALVGVGTVDELRKRFEDADLPLYRVDADSLLGRAKKPLERLARLTDASIQDIEAGRAAIEAVREETQDTEAFCDIVTAISIADPPLEVQFDRWEVDRKDIVGNDAHAKAQGLLKGLHPFHFPVAFPEVFLRARPGFDVILGNPPWQEATVEEHAFWARHYPGLRGLSQREQEQEKVRLRQMRKDLIAQYQAEVSEMDRLRRVLTSGAYPGMGTGDPDVYKAFCWRFWSLVVSDGGDVGVVLPRSALVVKGSSDFRRTMFGGARFDATLLQNRAGWVFDEAEHRYTVGLVAFAKEKPAGKSICLKGPYASYERYRAGMGVPAVCFTRNSVLAWNDTASLPLLPTEESIGVFAKLREAPRLDLDDGKSWRARPDAELHATAQKGLMDLKSSECPSGFWPVYKGESFDLWDPDTARYYAYADPDEVMPWIYGKRLRAAKSGRDSAHREFSLDHARRKDTLACFAPRIAFRDVSRATDTRTIRAALLPAHVFIANTAPYLLWPRGDELDQAYLLGILSSIPLDWYARRFVETHVNYFVLNPLPVPRPARSDARWRRIVDLAGRLAAPDERFAAWAKAAGVKAGPLGKGEDKQDIIHELDAVAAHLYGLSEAQLTHIFETFHEGWDYAPRLRAVLAHYRHWAGKA